MSKVDKILKLAEYVEKKEMAAKLAKDLKELKDEIEANIKPGQYGDYLINFETREVKEYIVSARVDVILKVSKLMKEIAL